ncbi:MAG: methyl-accepting chemotaxis protein [Candidatus Omnitrophota bacterium]
MAKRDSYKRRKYLINKRLQLKYATLLVISLTAVSFFVGVILYFGIWDFVAKEFSELIISQKISTVQRILSYESARYNKQEVYPQESPRSVMEGARRLSEHEKQAVKDILKKVNIRLIPRLLIVMLIIGAVSIVLTNKIAGPLYRFRKNFEAISKGDLSIKFNIRHGDDLKEVAEELEVMRERLLNFVIRYKELSGSLVTEIQNVSRAVEKMPSREKETAAAHLRKIQQLAEELKDLSDTFKTVKKES